MATTPYPFVANAILTASQLNSTFNIPVSTKTASYTLVAADAGTRVVMNSASATTITVNTSLFAAGDNLEILNIGAGVCTVTAGTATVSTSGTLALVANAGGTLYFTSTGVSVFQATGVTASAGAVTLIETLSPSAAATTQFTDGIITSAYKFYEVKYDLNTTFSFQMRNAGSTITSANYTRGGVTISTAGTVNNNYNTGETAVRIQTSNAAPRRFAGTCRLYAPSSSEQQLFTFDTSLSQYSGATQQTGAGLVYLYEANQAYTSLLFTGVGGNLTGTIKLYGWS
jgi:hypothetical protein